MTTGVRTLHAGQVLTGPLFNEPMRVETVQPYGLASWVVGLVGIQSERFRKVTLSIEGQPYDLSRIGKCYRHGGKRGS